jgi:5-(carboxyamino)imidazole ribonucleotide mutase
MSLFIAVLMGSESDLPVVQETLNILGKFSIPYEARVLSAHRTPEATRAYVHEAEARGAAVFIAAAGLAAHLAGAIAGMTLRPVIGLPLEAGALHGLDALLATVQMPGGVPVACVAIGKPGAKNAGYLAAQMLALSDPSLHLKLQADRAAQAQAILAHPPISG